MDRSQPKYLPSALQQMPEFERRLEVKEAAVFLDYDGTLSPIVSRPELAVVTKEMRTAVERLAKLCTVAVISGRSREAVQGFLGLDNVIYAGSHGLDIAGPGGSGLRNDIGREFQQTIDSVYAELSQEVKGIEGALVEHTTYSTTVHYRLVAPKEAARVEEVVNRVLQGYPSLHKTRGKMVWEIRPRIDWGKGKAVLWILDALGLDSSRALAFYIGDDVTDEDAFQALKRRGVGILVAESPRATAATHSLRSTKEVQEFLEGMVSLLKARPQS